MSDDPFEPSEDENDPEPENSTIKKLRAEIERRDKEIAKRDKDLRERESQIATFEARAKEQVKTKVFAEAGLNPKWANWFPEDQEASAENAKVWAAEMGLVQNEEPKPAQGFVTPTVQGTPAAQHRISYEEYRRMVTNPATFAKAIELRSQGLVEE